MPQRSGRAKNSASATANNEPEPSSKRETRQEPVRMCNWSNKTDGATGITWCPLHSPQSGRHLPETPAFSNWVCKFLLQWIADFFEIKLNVSALWLSGSVASGQWFGWLVCWPLNLFNLLRRRRRLLKATATHNNFSHSASQCSEIASSERRESTTTGGTTTTATTGYWLTYPKSAFIKAQTSCRCVRLLLGASNLTIHSWMKRPLIWAQAGARTGTEVAVKCCIESVERTLGTQIEKSLDMSKWATGQHYELCQITHAALVGENMLRTLQKSRKGHSWKTKTGKINSKSRKQSFLIYILVDILTKYGQ